VGEKARVVVESTKAAKEPPIPPGGPSLLDAVRGIGTDVYLQWALGLQMNSADDAKMANAIALDFARYGNLIAIMAQKPLNLLKNLYRMYTCTQDLREHTRKLVERAVVSNNVTREGVHAPSAAASASAAAASSISTVASTPSPRVDAVSRMAAAGFAIPEMAAELNHIFGAHKAAVFVLVQSLHDLCQPPRVVSCTTSPTNTNDDNIRAPMSLNDVGGLWWTERLREEWAEVLGVACTGTGTGGGNAPVSRSPRREDIIGSVPLLPLTVAVIEEATRLHTVSLGVVRQTGAPITVDGITIPSGTESVILISALHVHPALWIQPHNFCPHRWLSPQTMRAILERAQGKKVKETKADAAATAEGTTTTNTTSTTSDVFLVDGIRVSMSAGAPVLGSARTALPGGRKTEKGSEDSFEVDDDNEPTGSAQSPGRFHYESKPSRLDIESAVSSPDTPRPAPPFSFIPFLRGGRLCLGKDLARLELAVALHGILSRVNLRTHVRYIGHIHGVPVGTGVGTKLTEKDLPDLASGVLRFEEGYQGPLQLLLSDDMYATIEGDVPFSVSSIY
jgi:hypothetical protein